MRNLLLHPLLLGFSVPAIAHNEANGDCGNHFGYSQDPGAMGEGEIDCPPNDLEAC